MYSDLEKKDIKKRLQNAAADCMMKYGVKKTTVDELVRIANIPKGTFYLFYESKELLLFEVILELHTEIENSMFEDISKIITSMNPDNLTNIIVIAMKKVCESCLLRIMTSNDIEVLSQKLPKEVLEMHLLHDDDNAEKILELFPNTGSLSKESISGAFRGVFFAMIYKREIGEENFYESIRIMVKGIIMQLF